VIHPDTVDAGQPFDVLIVTRPGFTGTRPIYLGMQLPSDWQVLGSPHYTAGLSGTFTYSPTAITSLETEFGSLTGTTWWAGAGPSLAITGGLTLSIQANLQSSLASSGVYTPHYIYGVYSDTLNWVNTPISSPITVTAFSPHITIIKTASLEVAHTFAFNGDLGDFSLPTNGSQTFSDLTPGNYTIHEDPTSFPDQNWALLSVVCEGNSEHVVVDLPNGQATIPLQTAEDIVCTFHNERANLEAETYTLYLPVILRDYEQ
jgi:hypothetical protein